MFDFFNFWRSKADLKAIEISKNNLDLLKIFFNVTSEEKYKDFLYAAYSLFYSTFNEAGFSEHKYVSKYFYKNIKKLSKTKSINKKLYKRSIKNFKSEYDVQNLKILSENERKLLQYGAILHLNKTAQKMLLEKLK